MNKVTLVLFFISFFTQAAHTQDLAEKYHIKGVEFQEKGIYTRAIDYYTAVLEKKPLFSKSRYNRAIVYFQIKKYNKALFDIRQLISENPFDAELYSFMGLIYAKLQKPTEALHYINEALSLQDKPIFHLRKADILLQNHQPELAFNELTVVNLEPNLEIAALELKATAYLSLQQTNQALRTYDAIIRLHPIALFHFNRGLLHKKIGNHDKAYADFKEAAKESLFLAPLKELIRYQWIKGDAEGLKTTVRKGITDFPNEPIFYKYAGLDALKKGSHLLALEWFEKAKKLGATELDIQINIGIAYLPTDKKKAKEALLLALKIDPTNAIAKHNIQVINRSE